MTAESRFANQLDTLRQLPASARVGLFLLIVLVAASLFPSLIAPFDPVEIGAGPPQSGPSSEHRLGTDQLGRDVFSRIVWGARVSLFASVFGISIAIVAGAFLGALAAVTKRWLNVVLERLLDLLISFPVTVLAVVLATALTPGFRNIVLVLAIIYTPAVARVVRANVLSEYEEDYVTAERALGASRTRILTQHVAINIAAPVLVFALVLLADAVVIEMALSFIGVGIQQPTASWGNVIADGTDLINSGGWWVTTFGGAAVFIAVLAINSAAEGFTDLANAPTRRRTGDQPETDQALDPAVPNGADDSASTLVNAQAHNISIVTPGGPEVGAPILEIEDLSIRFRSAHGDVNIVDELSLTIHRNEVLGLAGESGSGKSLTGLAIMGLLPPYAEVTGSIRFDGVDLLSLAASKRRQYLGTEIAMIHQDALSALNPSFRIRTQLEQLSKRGSVHTPGELMDMVGLPEPSLLRAYPHQLSGGQRQRVLIAMALSRDPAFLVADEPTTALDETVQAQIVDLLAEIRSQRELSMLLISHDMALVAQQSHRIAVMYAGRLVESDHSAELLTNPVHPYTTGLLASILSLEAKSETLYQIPGVVPAPSEFARGCRFAGRCASELLHCSTQQPDLATSPQGRIYACHNPGKDSQEVNA